MYWEDIVIPGIIVAVVVGLVLLIAGSINASRDDGHRRNRAEIYAIQKVCEGRGVAFDVQGEDKLVYACASDGKLRTINYGKTR